METITAARGQMTLTLVFHMIFAATGIGLPLLMVVAEGLWLRTGRPHYKQLAKTWSKATGILFAVGAVSGTALSFELGLLWPKYMEITGAVVGHIFGLEGFAFFIEAIFISLYLYGWDRLSPGGHWLCGVVVAVSGMTSGLMILGVNAWMQLPVGFTMEAGRVAVTDPVAIFKRYGWLTMAIHSTLSCYISVGFAAAAIAAGSWLRGRRDEAVRSAMRIGLAVGGLTAVLQPLSGDSLAKFVFGNEPTKFAAMEGQFRTQKHAPLRIGGWPDVKAGETKYAIEIPGGLSFLATHDFNAEVHGLDDVPVADRPPVEIVHMAFQVMVGCGMTLIALSAWFWLTNFRKGRETLENRWLVRAVCGAGPLGFLALETGWMVTEVGRQPWVIHGVLRTADAVTPAAGVPAMFFGFSVLYLVLGVSVVVLLRGLRSGDPRVEPPQTAPLNPPRNVEAPEPALR